MTVCVACGVDAARLRQLEVENEALRAQVEALSCGGGAPLKRPVLLDPPASAEMCSPARHHVVRGYTAAGLAEVEAAVEMQQGDLEVSVGDAPRRCNEAIGACTVVRVNTLDRPGLLAQLSAVLAGVDLSIAKAFFRTSEAGVVSNEFWVQQIGSDGLLGPVIEGVKRRAIEQRIRQWSAGQRLELRAQHVAFSHASDDLSELLRLPDWQGAVELPQHNDDDEGPSIGSGAPRRAAFVEALTSALITECSWLGALPPVLARQTASALLPRLCRVRLSAGATVRRNRPDQLGTDFLLLLEEAMPVNCGHRSLDGTPTAPIEPDACESRVHPPGSVLCLSSTVEGAAGRQLAWHSLSAPLGGVVAVVGRAALRELLGDTRKTAVRRHAKQLASAPFFAPLGTSQLLALCHRAVETEAAPMSRIVTVGGAAAPVSMPFSRQGSAAAGGAAMVAAADDPELPPGSSSSSCSPTPVFLIVLRGSALVSYTPPAGSAASYACARPGGALPIHRLRPNEHYGVIDVLSHRVETHLELHAGEEGCTLLSWTSDECKATDHGRPSPGPSLRSQ